MDGSGEPQYEKAAGYYQAGKKQSLSIVNLVFPAVTQLLFLLSSAAERQDSALALFNLGYMYENGLGVPKVTSPPSVPGVRKRTEKLIEHRIPAGLASRQKKLRPCFRDQPRSFLPRHLGAHEAVRQIALVDVDRRAGERDFSVELDGRESG